MNNFQDVEAWKMARQFRNEIRLVAQSFPPDEKYKLTDQITRSSRSITANISEGFGRYHHQENIQFCRTARGSLNETSDHLICAFDCEYITEKQLKELSDTHNTCLKILNGYIAYLKRAKQEAV
jgi:four helix bundle protein